MKKTVCVLISALLCLVCTLPAFAGEEKTAFILVSGMSSLPLYSADGEQIYPVGTKSIIGLVTKIFAPVLVYSVTGDGDRLCDKIDEPVAALFEQLKCDKNGDSIYSVNAETFYDVTGHIENEESDELALVRAAAEKYGNENAFFFNYDWRLDPLDHADGLNAFIKEVRARTGCGRLELAAYSMGGGVVMSYLYKYGSADIDSLVLAGTAFQGTSCVGDMFAGDIELDTEGLIKRLSQLTRNDAGMFAVDTLNGILNKAGVTGGVDALAKKLLDDTSVRVYDEILTPVFGQMPGLWALVDDERYEDAKAFMLGSGEYPGLVSRIDDYHYNVQRRAFELLTEAKKDTSVYIIAQYNMQGLPVSDTASHSNNDFLIDTVYASGGATCAKLGETLGGNYVQAVDTGFDCLSADGQIDSSTAFFPECTWFVRDMGHIDFPFPGGTELILYLSGADTQLTVTGAEYPQYLSYDYATDSYTPVTVDTGKKLTLIDLIRNFFSSFFARFNINLPVC